MPCVWTDLVGVEDTACIAPPVAEIYAYPAYVTGSTQVVGATFYTEPALTLPDGGMGVDYATARVTHVKAWYDIGEGCNCAIVDFFRGDGAWVGLAWGDPGRMPNDPPVGSGFALYSDGDIDLLLTSLSPENLPPPPSGEFGLMFACTVVTDMGTATFVFGQTCCF